MKLVKIKSQKYHVLTVSMYLGVDKEEDDASTDKQEELGWIPGEVSDCQAFSAERTENVSKAHRKKVQFDAPGLPQRVKKLPRNREADRTTRQSPPIPKDIQLNSNQTGTPKRSTPMRVNQHKFEGKNDNKFLPMDIDQNILAKTVNNSRKGLLHKDKTSIPKVSNVRSAKGCDSTTLAQDILDTPLTLSVREIVGILPTLQQELTHVMKQECEAPSQGQEKTGFTGKVVCDSNKATLCEPSIHGKSGKLKDVYDPDKLVDVYNPDKLKGICNIDDIDDIVDSHNSDKFFSDTEDNSSEDGTYTLYTPSIFQGPLPLACEELLKVPARLGPKAMTGVFDSGSQINIISKELVEAAGLPWTTDRKSRLRLLSVNRKVSQCEGKVPNAKILLTELQLPTYGDLYVKPNPGFDLLLGRAWGTLNQANLRKAPDRSYLSIESDGARYELNACPNLDYEGDDEENDEDASAYQKPKAR